MSIFKPTSGVKFFSKKKNTCEKRSEANNFKGPLNINILSIIYGSLLGDAYAEKREKGKGTRINFYQEGSHKDYLLYLHNLVANLGYFPPPEGGGKSNLGYCNTLPPKIKTRLGTKGKIRQVIRFSTWTYTQFNYIYNDWYIDKIKRIPKNMNIYFSPLALAIWIMDDGCKVGKGLRLATNSFKYKDILFLVPFPPPYGGGK